MLHPRDAAKLMTGFNRPWWFAGGWALELFAGRKLREHEDTEIGIWRDDQFALRAHMNGWQWETAVTIDGVGQWVAWKEGERVELPNFQLKASQDKAHELEFMCNDQSDGEFLFRRDPAIRLAASQLILRTSSNLPYLAPEVQLLYKAKHHRPKDESDFSAVLEKMGGDRRRWLKLSLQRWDPKDPWIDRL